MRWLTTGKQIGKTIKNAARLRKIVAVLATHGFQNVAERIKLGRFTVKKSQLEHLSAPERLRMAFEQLGPTFVKLGQLLATRPDLIPSEFVEEFKKLQNQAQPLPFEEIKEVLDEHFGDQFEIIFSSFDESPLAAASIAQVHRAVLATGESVVVKVQRPGIIEIIDEDLGVLYQLAQLIETYVPEWDIYDPVGIVDEFFKALQLETDFVVEANNLRRFAKNFSEDDGIKVPRVHMSHCGHRVLVMEAMEGVPLSDPRAMQGDDVDAEKVVQTALRCYFKMVFKDGFFHGDLHAGNFFVLDDHRIGLIDFGVVGRLNRRTQDSVTNMLVALAVEDYDRVAYEYVDLAPYSEGLDVDRFAKDLRDLVAPYHGLSLKNINVGKILMDSAAVAAKHRLKVPSELMLYFKSMISIESLGRQMIRDFDFMEHALAFSAELVQTKFEPKRLAKDLSDMARDGASLSYDLPRQLRQLLRKVGSPYFTAKFRVENLSEVRRGLEHSGNLVFLGLVTGSLVVAGALTADQASRVTLLGLPLISAILFGLAGFYSLVAFYNYIRK